MHRVPAENLNPVKVAEGFNAYCRKVGVDPQLLVKAAAPKPAGYTGALSPTLTGSAGGGYLQKNPLVLPTNSGQRPQMGAPMQGPPAPQPQAATSQGKPGAALQAQGGTPAPAPGAQPAAPVAQPGQQVTPAGVQLPSARIAPGQGVGLGGTVAQTRTGNVTRAGGKVEQAPSRLITRGSSGDLRSTAGTLAEEMGHKPGSPDHKNFVRKMTQFQADYMKGNTNEGKDAWQLMKEERGRAQQLGKLNQPVEVGEGADHPSEFVTYADPSALGWNSLPSRALYRTAQLGENMVMQYPTLNAAGNELTNYVSPDNWRANYQATGGPGSELIGKGTGQYKRFVEGQQTQPGGGASGSWGPPAGGGGAPAPGSGQGMNVSPEGQQYLQDLIANRARNAPTQAAPQRWATSSQPQQGTNIGASYLGGGKRQSLL